MTKKLWLGMGLLLVAFLISIHHFVISGKFFDMKDVLHHEFLLALFGGMGFGVIVGTRVK